MSNKNKSIDIKQENPMPIQGDGWPGQGSFLSSQTTKDAKYLLLQKTKNINSLGKAKLDGVIDASHGGQWVSDPVQMAREAGAAAFFGKTFLLYIADKAQEAEVSISKYMDGFRKPEYPINLRDVYYSRYEKAAKKDSQNVSEEGFEAFLEKQVQKDLKLAKYPSQTLGSTEVRDVFKEYLIANRIPADKSMVIIGGNGFKSMYGAAIAAILTEEFTPGHRKPRGGIVVASEGYYHSLSSVTELFGGRFGVIKNMDAENIDALLKKSVESENQNDKVRTIVIPIVNNPTGEILDYDKLEGIANVILNHNKNHPNEKVTIISDEIYRDCILDKEIERTPCIAEITIEGKRMHDCTFSINAVSKTFAAASFRIGSMSSGDKDLMIAAGDFIRQLGTYSIAPPMEIAAAAAVSFTEMNGFIEKNNEYYRKQLDHITSLVSDLNSKHEEPILEVSNPDGGWYTLIKISKDIVPEKLKPLLNDSGDMHKYLIHWGEGEPDTGVVTFPGKVLGYESNLEINTNGANRESDDFYMHRVTLALTPEELTDVVSRIERATAKLQTLSIENLENILEQGKYRGNHQSYHLTL